MVYRFLLSHGDSSDGSSFTGQAKGWRLVSVRNSCSVWFIWFHFVSPNWLFWKMSKLPERFKAWSHEHPRTTSPLSQSTATNTLPRLLLSLCALFMKWIWIFFPSFFFFLTESLETMMQTWYSLPKPFRVYVIKKWSPAWCPNPFTLVTFNVDPEIQFNVQSKFRAFFP